MKQITIFSDGGARGNPGHGGYGFVILDGKTNLYKGKKYLGTTTNNQAEYQGILNALKYVKEKIASKDKQIQIICNLDSKLIVEQLNGNYKVKNEGLKPLYWEIRELIIELGGKIMFKHIAREYNKQADLLVNEAIDEAINKK